MSLIMKKLLLIILFIFSINYLYEQIEVRDSIFIKIKDLKFDKLTYSLSDGKITYLSIEIPNKYEKFTSFLTGYFGSNLTLKQKHKLNPKKILTYEEYVNLINKDIMNVYYYYKVYFIISEAKYDYLTLQVRQILPPEFRKQ